jgi:hypothetical protein
LQVDWFIRTTKLVINMNKQIYKISLLIKEVEYDQLYAFSSIGLMSLYMSMSMIRIGWNQG